MSRTGHLETSFPCKNKTAEEIKLIFVHVKDLWAVAVGNKYRKKLGIMHLSDWSKVQRRGQDVLHATWVLK